MCHSTWQINMNWIFRCFFEIHQVFRFLFKIHYFRKPALWFISIRPRNKFPSTSPKNDRLRPFLIIRDKSDSFALDYADNINLKSFDAENLDDRHYWHISQVGWRHLCLKLHFEMINRFRFEPDLVNLAKKSYKEIKETEFIVLVFSLIT